MDAIYTRRSIRKFTDQEVTDEQVDELLRAAMAAPSAGNQQPWHFVVIRDRGLLEAVPGFHDYAAMTPEAALAIVVCGDPTLEKHEGFWVQDCSAATENLLLKVADLGLGAVWLGVYPREERVRATRELLGIPEHVVPFCIVPVGHPAEEVRRVDRYKPERVHRDGWSAR